MSALNFEYSLLIPEFILAGTAGLVLSPTSSVASCG